MKVLNDLFDKNRLWAENIRNEDPQFFSTLSKQQAPKYLWIGCADSRVPANEIVGLLPGELFVHRNAANLVQHTDFNCLSVLQYAVEVLKVEHIIVCGHYGCGGVHAAFKGSEMGLIDNWLMQIREVRRRHSSEIMTAESEKECVDRLCEFNVAEQVINVSRTTIVRSAWAKKQQLSVHGWIYSIQDGLLHDLGLTIENRDQIPEYSEVGKRIEASRG